MDVYVAYVCVYMYKYISINLQFHWYCIELHKLRGWLPNMKGM